MTTISIRDQENLTHTHQQAAAAKPLNQGVRGLAPKTPGNNGNRNGMNGRTGRGNRGQDDENIFLGGKTGKTGKPTFITPLAQRERAPLGAKTTNVKANAFKTPMPKTGGFEVQKTQIRSTSARKHKLKVHQPEVVAAEPIILSEDDSEPEIEYCPPKITPMLDLPELGFSPDHKFPEVNGLDILAAAYHESRDRYDPIGSDGLRRSAREALQKQKGWQEKSDRMLEEEVRKSCQLKDADLEYWGLKPRQKELSTSRRDAGARKPSTHAPTTGTSSSRTVAAFNKSQPSFAAPTAAAQARNATVVSNAPRASSQRARVTTDATSRSRSGRPTANKVSDTEQKRPASSGTASKSSRPVVTLDEFIQEFEALQDRDECEDDDGIPFKRFNLNDNGIPGFDDFTNFKLEL